MKQHNGFTLVEMMMVLAVMAIIVTTAVPSMNSYRDINRLRGSTGQLFSDMQYARSESIKRNANISVSVTSNGTTSWCYGLHEVASCDCTITDTTNTSACTLSISGTNVLKVGSISDFTNISMTSPIGTNQTIATFDPVRGLATTTGNVIFQATDGTETHIDVSVLGRISACTPAGINSLAGYSAC